MDYWGGGGANGMFAPLSTPMHVLSRCLLQSLNRAAYSSAFWLVSCFEFNGHLG